MLTVLPVYRAAPVFSPHIVSPQSCLLLKCLLQHQPWKIEYSLDPEQYVTSVYSIVHALYCNTMQATTLVSP